MNFLAKIKSIGRAADGASLVLLLAVALGFLASPVQSQALSDFFYSCQGPVRFSKNNATDDATRRYVDLSGMTFFSMAMGGQYLYMSGFWWGNNTRFIAQMHTSNLTIRQYFATTTYNYDKIVAHGDSLYGVSNDVSWYQWNVTDGSVIRKVTDAQSGLCGLAVAGDYVATSGWDYKIRVYNRTNGTRLLEWLAHSGGECLAAIFIYDNFIFSGGNDNLVKMWFLNNGTLLRTMTGHTGFISAIVVQNGYVYSGSYDNTTRRWDYNNGSCVAVYTGHTDRVTAIAVFKTWLITGSKDTTMRRWNTQNGTSMRTFTIHNSELKSVIIPGVFSTCAAGTFGSDGECFPCPPNAQCPLASPWPLCHVNHQYDSSAKTCSACPIGMIGAGGWDDCYVPDWFISDAGTELYRWNITTGTTIATTTAVRGMYALALGNGGNAVFGGPGNGTYGSVQQWQIGSTLTASTSYAWGAGVFQGIAVTDAFVFAGGYDFKVYQWHLGNGSLFRTFTEATATLNAIAVAGDFLVTAAADQVIRVYSIASGQLLRNLTGAGGSFGGGGQKCLAIYHDFVFAGISTGEAKIWSISNGTLIRTIFAHTTSIRSMGLQGRYLFTGSNDNTTKRWDWTNGTLMTTYTGHTNYIFALVPYGNFLLTCGDTTVRRYSITSGTALQTYTGHTTSTRGIVVPNQISTCAAGFYGADGVCWQCPSGGDCPLGSLAPINCNPGEAVDQSTKTCYTCPAETFSRGGNALSCQACPAGATIYGASGARACVKPNVLLTFGNARALTASDCQSGSIPSQWNNFTANGSPTLVMNNLTQSIYVKMNRSQWLQGPATSFKTKTNNGLTIITLFRLSGTAASNERVYEFGTATGINSFVLHRFKIYSNPYFGVSDSSGAFAGNGLGDNLLPNTTWVLHSARVDSNLFAVAKIFGVTSKTQFSAASVWTEDLVRTSMFIGRSPSGDAASLDIAFLGVWDSYLSDEVFSIFENRAITLRAYLNGNLSSTLPTETNSFFPLSLSYATCLCTAGYYGTSNGCVACPSGTYCPQNTLTPQPCPIGSFCTTPAVVANCPTGTYCPENSTTPQACPAGSYCSTPSAFVTCPSGSSCPQNSSAPVPCPTGWSTDRQTGSDRCINPPKVLLSMGAARTLTISDCQSDSVISSWNGYTAYGSPKIVQGSNSQQSYLSTNISQYLQGPTTPFNTTTNGGLTLMVLFRLPSLSPIANERVFEFGTGWNENVFMLKRSIQTSALFFGITNGSKAILGTTISSIVQPDKWLVFSARVNAARSVTVRFNQTITSTFSVVNVMPGDLSRTSMLVGKSPCCEQATMDLAYLSVWDTYMSDSVFAYHENRLAQIMSVLNGGSNLLGNETSASANLVYSQCRCPSGYFGTSSGCSQCTAGNYCPGGLAPSTPCPNGTYCPSNGMIGPTGCPTGTYCPTTGLANPVNCPTGSYCPNVNMTNPINCPAGSYCPFENMTSATVCPAGTYCSSTGMTVATPCLAGNICPDTGLDAPVPCSPGSYCPTGGTVSQPCPLGFVCVNPSSLAPCASTYYCPVNTSVAALCLAGTYCPNANVSIACPQNQYCPAGSLSPTQCGSNSFTTSNGSTAITDCKCNAGYYGSAGSCTTCPIDYYCPADSESPQACSANTGTLTTGATSLATCVCDAGYSGSPCALCSVSSFKPDEGNQLCTPCPTNAVCTSTSWGCDVLFTLSGGNCVACPSGWTKPLVGNMSCSDCRNFAICTGNSWECDQGATLKTDESGCEQCPAGSYKSTVGNTTCAACTVGSYCPLGAKVEAQCPGGFYCPNATVKVACDSGDHCPLGSTSRQKCTAGSYCSSLTSQVACDNGYYCPEGSQIAQNCPVGAYCSTPSVLGNCTAGQLCPLRSTEATACPAGSFCGSFTSATPCIPGDYCPAGIAAPQDCPEGSYCATPATVSACVSGQYCPARSAEAINCTAGYFCPTFGNKTACTIGQYCPEKSIAPLMCPAGSRCPFPEEKIACSSGEYCPAGSTIAQTCSAGQYCPNATSAINCSINHYCPAASANQSACPANSQTLSVGTSDISQCLCNVGSYRNQSECIICPANSQTLAGGATDISQCLCNVGSYRNQSECAMCPANSQTPAIGASNISQCICNLGTYSNQNECINCPENAICAPNATEPFWVNVTRVQVFPPSNGLGATLPQLVTVNSKVTQKWAPLDNMNISVNSVGLDGNGNVDLVKSVKSLFDGDASTEFVSNDTVATWSSLGLALKKRSVVDAVILAVDFAETTKLANYTITSSCTSPDHSGAPTHWTVQAYNGSDWVVLETVSSINWQLCESRSFIMNNMTGLYSSYRWRFDANNYEWVNAGTQAIVMSEMTMQFTTPPLSIAAGASSFASLGCPAGMYGSLQVACQLCTPNHYCPANSANQMQCSSNSHNNDYGSSAVAACKCDLGYYGGSSSCQLCPAGSYCPPDETTLDIVCPDGTTSLAGSTSVANCTSLPVPTDETSKTVTIWQALMQFIQTPNGMTAVSSSAGLLIVIILVILIRRLRRRRCIKPMMSARAASTGGDRPHRYSSAGLMSAAKRQSQQMSAKALMESNLQAMQGGHVVVSLNIVNPSASVQQVPGVVLSSGQQILASNSIREEPTLMSASPRLVKSSKFKKR